MTARVQSLPGAMEFFPLYYTTQNKVREKCIELSK
jgi:hypothetical protein